jgi:hypothetical protein
VKEGDAVALLAPLDGKSRQPREFIARLEVPEKHGEEVAVGQAVRLSSLMYSQRLYGQAEARIERVEPAAEVVPGGARVLRAEAVVTRSPFPLKLGSGFKAEVVVGRKAVYRIILEQ